MLHTMPATVPSKYYQSENIRVGFFRIEDLKFGPKAMIDKILSGILPTPQGELRFPPGQQGDHSIYFSPFHSDGIPIQFRQMNLFIRGERRPQVPAARLDWEVRSAAAPFESLQELCADMMVGPRIGDLTEIRVIGQNIVAISDESLLRGNEAQLVIRLAHGLDPLKASIGIRILEKQKATNRFTIDGMDLAWQKNDSFQRGQVSAPIPVGAALYCIACYAGQGQHFWWVTDPQTAQNPFRVIHEVFDNKLAVLRELSEKAQIRGGGGNARTWRWRLSGYFGCLVSAQLT